MRDVTTRLVRIDPAVPDPAVLGDAASVVRGGGVIGFPTETFYGLGAAALDGRAVRRVVAVKGRPEGKPILVLIGSAGMLAQVASAVPDVARGLMARHWPGALTLVLPARAEVPEEVTARTGTVGVRWSPHPVATGLVRSLGQPLTAPSANPSSQAPAATAHEVMRYFAGDIDLVLDAGPTAGGLPSTVVDVTTGEIRVIRAGAVRL